MKMPKFAIFVKKKRNLKINMLRIKSVVKLGHYTGQYRGAHLVYVI